MILSVKSFYWQSGLHVRAIIKKSYDTINIADFIADFLMHFLA